MRARVRARVRVEVRVGFRANSRLGGWGVLRHLRDEIAHHLLVRRHEHAQPAVEARGGALLQQLEGRGQPHAERGDVEAPG